MGVKKIRESRATVRFVVVVPADLASWVDQQAHTLTSREGVNHTRSGLVRKGLLMLREAAEKEIGR